MQTVPDTTYINALCDCLSGFYNAPRVLLRYNSPFELLISVILSAQTTDRQVNQVTPELFTRYPDPLSLKNAVLEDLESIVRSTGFYRNKARNIILAASVLEDRFHGKVPGTMKDLLQIPGVGRKSANVVLGHCFNRPVIIVDTHFMRVSNRLKLVTGKNPDYIERFLSGIIPEDKQTAFSMHINYLGRDFCQARNPDCSHCPLLRLCPSAVL